MVVSLDAWIHRGAVRSHHSAALYFRSSLLSTHYLYSVSTLRRRRTPSSTSLSSTGPSLFPLSFTSSSRGRSALFISFYFFFFFTSFRGSDKNNVYTTLHQSVEHIPVATRHTLKGETKRTDRSSSRAPYC